MFQLSVADVADLNIYIYICIVCPVYLFFFNYNLFKILIMNFSATDAELWCICVAIFPSVLLNNPPTHISLHIKSFFFFFCHKGESVWMLWSDLIVSLLISRRMFLKPREMGHAGKNKKINKKVKKIRKQSNFGMYPWQLHIFSQAQWQRLDYDLLFLLNA